MNIISIRNVANGFVVSWEEPYNDNSHLSHHEEYVFEEAEISDCNRRHLIGALYKIIDQLGEYGSKHDEHRIRVLCECQTNKEEEI